MNSRLIFLLILIIATLTIAGCGKLRFWQKNATPTEAPEAALNAPAPPAKPVKLIFLHHSTGGNWLADVGEHEFAGGLGQALMENNYFVSGVNYDWTVNGDDIGNRTDIGHWWEWFNGPKRNEYMEAVYNEFDQNLRGKADWTFFGNFNRMDDPDPTHENDIIMFKACYPNSHLAGNPNDPPTVDDNPLQTKDAWAGDEFMTVSNVKGIYIDLLDYFGAHPDKLFVVITAPPLVKNDSWQKTDAQHAANARAFNNWLLNEWLADYPHENVAAFDFYNVLTSNNGSRKHNDIWLEEGNHHRWWNGTVQHIQTEDDNFSAYGARKDSHPSAAGGQKATAEFVPLLNYYYHRWQGN
ncbi:MAG: hypothetical protein GY803_07445 [Chloroflexi bacterium]|nr:hypothetical protein [Chloroflexota bacterium]